MIVIDTSAIMAIALGESTAEACSKVIQDSNRFSMSAVTKIELMIVAARRNRLEDVKIALQLIDIEIMPVTVATIDQVTSAYERWGKGIHPAALNICDCFAYALAIDLGCPLLFVGDDFAKTDVIRVI